MEHEWGMGRRSRGKLSSFHLEANLNHHSQNVDFFRKSPRLVFFSFHEKRLFLLQLWLGLDFLGLYYRTKNASFLPFPENSPSFRTSGLWSNSMSLMSKFLPMSRGGVCSPSSTTEQPCCGRARCPPVCKGIGGKYVPMCIYWQHTRKSKPSEKQKSKP